MLPLRSSAPLARRHQAPEFPVDFIHGLFGQFVRWFFIMTGCLRTRYHGPLPYSGFVIVCNHRSFLDPLVLGCTLRRRIHYFARDSLWKIAPIRWVLELFGGIPVNRERPQSASMGICIQALRAGHSLLMFPEGTRSRSGRMGPLRDGPALIARRAGVPIVPVYLRGTESVWPRGCPLPLPGRGRLEVRFGPALRADPLLPPREQDSDLSQRIAAWLLKEESDCYGPDQRLEGRPR